MKRFESIGELLIAYREINNLSQSDFAEKINVDTRTIQRWERGETLVKAEKEEDIVIATFLPYQLIRNLNSTIPIPTYYDFRIRKYSTNEISNELPDAIWFKKDFKVEHENIRTIDYNFDIKYLIRYLNFQKNVPNNILEAIKKAVEIVPELNKVITDDAGYYSGHSIIFPISVSAFEKLKNKEIKEDQITVNDLVDFKKQDLYIFYNYDIAADNNFNTYYLVNNMLKFFKSIETTNYVYCGIITRYDSFKVNEQIGIEIVWQDEPKLDKANIEVYPRFCVGNFNNYLVDMEG